MGESVQEGGSDWSGEASVTGDWDWALAVGPAKELRGLLFFGLVRTAGLRGSSGGQPEIFAWPGSV